MKKFVVVSLLIFGTFLAATAQSGRKIEATPTPSPNADESGEKTYSDSVPVKPRTRIMPPARGDNKSNAPIQNTNTQKPIILSDDADEVKIETNLITIPVSVFDRNGIYIPNLTQQDFKIFEDGSEQEIAYFATSEKPFTVVLLLDTSLSASYKIEEIQDAAIAFVNQLKPQDSVMVIEFAWTVNLLSELTTDRQKIYKGIRKADIDQGTSIYDAVNHVLRKRLNKIEGRKAIVLFTDGVDTTSDAASYDSTLSLAEESDVTIFPIYYNTYLDNQQISMGGIWSTGGVSRREYALGKRYVEDLAAATGGRIFEAESTAVGLTRTFESIAEELRRQYSIGYYPQEAGQTGQRKQIKVRVTRPNLIVRARDSYIVGAKPVQQTQPVTKTQ